MLVTCATPLAAQAPADPAGLVRVEIQTSLGSIVAELDSARAPLTVMNFLRYVDAGAYSPGVFYRTVTSRNQPVGRAFQVIQGGLDPKRGFREFPPIPLERTSETGLRHVNGTLSMAHGAPDDATADFFIVIGDQPSLDFGHPASDGQGFAAFGRVTRGMNVVRAIQEAPAQQQTLSPPVTITRITRSR